MKSIDKPKQFAHDLCEWYRENKRDLPFRKSRDPYRIFLSELMLQQTQISTMLPYYERFIGRFPDVKSLADASLDEVLKYWEGLGYYSRARYIHESAQMIVREFDGQFPRELKTIESLKGVGRYTARAIHSIAYDEPSVAVDGNVMRVMSRVLLFDGEIKQTKNMRHIESILDNVIVHERPSDFTQALMELGALVCKKRPDCEVCPLKDKCFAYKLDKQDAYPVVSKAKPKTEHHYHVFVVRHQNRYLLRRRPSHGLLANMHEFPQYESSYETALETLQNEFSLSIAAVHSLGTQKHVFSHKVWTMQAYEVVLKRPVDGLVNLENYPNAMSKAHHKIIEKIKEKGLPPWNH